MLAGLAGQACRRRAPELHQLPQRNYQKNTVFCLLRRRTKRAPRPARRRSHQKSLGTASAACVSSRAQATDAAVTSASVASTGRARRRLAPPSPPLALAPRAPPTTRGGSTSALQFHRCDIVRRPRYPCSERAPARPTRRSPASLHDGRRTFQEGRIAIRVRPRLESNRRTASNHAPPPRGAPQLTPSTCPPYPRCTPLASLRLRTRPSAGAVTRRLAWTTRVRLPFSPAPRHLATSRPLTRRGYTVL